MKFARNGSVKLAYYEMGQGKPLFLVSGYGARAAHWGGDFLNLMAEGHRVFSLDNRGTGESDRPKEPWTMADMAADVISTMDETGLSHVNLSGISMGGMIAQELAINYPERVSTLTLISTSTGGASEIPGDPGIADALFEPDTNQPVKKMLEGIWRALCAPEFFEMPGNLEECIRLDLEKPTHPYTLSIQQKAIWQADFSSKVSEINVPTLIVSGDKDRLISPANSARLAELIPNSRLVTIKNCGHIICLERPRELAESMLQFLSEHGV
jgi:pimeloyl-ACP methyl ester carboxylesterase